MDKITLADLHKLKEELTKSDNPKIKEAINVIDILIDNMTNSFTIMNKDEAINLFARKFGTKEDLKDIDFNDEIIELEEIGEEETIDIEVTGNHLFYANDILTHNSAFNNLEAGVENISESIGVIMTADVALVLLTNEQLREQKQVMIKSEKNRYTGKLNKVILEVNWPKMKFKGIDEDDDLINDLNNMAGFGSMDTTNSNSESFKNNVNTNSNSNNSNNNSNPSNSEKTEPKETKKEEDIEDIKIFEDSEENTTDNSEIEFNIVDDDWEFE